MAQRYEPTNDQLIEAYRKALDTIWVLSVPATNRKMTEVERLKEIYRVSHEALKLGRGQ